MPHLTRMRPRGRERMSSGSPAVPGLGVGAGISLKFCSRLTKQRVIKGQASAIRWKMGQALTQSPHQAPARQRMFMRRRKALRRSCWAAVSATAS